MNDPHDNLTRAAKAYDDFISTDVEAERQAVKEARIEDRAIEIYHQILDDPELMAEALTEIQWNCDSYREFTAALGNAISREVPQYDIQYLACITDSASEMLMDYSECLALSWYENLQ